MASVSMDQNSPFWIANITRKDGSRTRKSTKKTDRVEAQMLADKWEAEGVVEVGKVRDGRITPEKLALVSGVVGVEQFEEKAQSGNEGKKEGEKEGGDRSIEDWVERGGVVRFDPPADRRWAGRGLEWLTENWGVVMEKFEVGREINCDEVVERLRGIVPGEVFGRWVVWWYLGNRARIFEYPYLKSEGWLGRLVMEMRKVIDGKVRDWSAVTVVGRGGKTKQAKVEEPDAPPF